MADRGTGAAAITCGFEERVTTYYFVSFCRFWVYRHSLHTCEYGSMVPCIIPHIPESLVRSLVVHRSTSSQLGVLDQVEAFWVLRLSGARANTQPPP